MDVEPFLVADTLLGVVAQRLVRRPVQAICRAALRAERRLELSEVGLHCRADRQVLECHDLPSAWAAKTATAWATRGRTGIYEFLPENSDEIQRLVIGNASSAQITKVAIEQGMFTLLRGWLSVKVFQGVTTTFEEVKRVTAADPSRSEVMAVFEYKGLDKAAGKAVSGHRRRGHGEGGPGPDCANRDTYSRPKCS